MKNLAITIVVLIVLLHLVSCSGTQSRIIGKWQEFDSTETLEFLKDGTIKLVADNGAVIEGKYTFVEKDHIKIELRAGEKQLKEEWKVKISGNEMILTFLPNNRAIGYRRLN